MDWLKLKLETLEAALLSGSLDSGLLAALDGGGSMSRAEVLEAARAAVQSAVLLSSGGAPQQGLPEDGPQQGEVAGLLSLEPLASQLASAAQAASAAAEAAVGGQVVGLHEAGEIAVEQLGSGRASTQLEAAMPAEMQQPTVLTKLPLIERLLISEALEAPAACAPEPCEPFAVTAAPAAGVTATVSLVVSAVGSKSSEAGQPGGLVGYGGQVPALDGH